MGMIKRVEVPSAANKHIALGYVLNAPLGRYWVSTVQPPSDVLSLLDINPLKGVYVIEGDIISPQFH